MSVRVGDRVEVAGSVLLGCSFAGLGTISIITNQHFIIMVFTTSFHCGIAGVLLALLSPALAADPVVQLHKGDHVAIVGSGLADRQQHHGWLEALIHRANPEAQLTFRNLGFAADEVDLHPRSADDRLCP